MPSPMSEESKALLRMLADGQEHRLAEVLSRLAEAIAPGRALRKYEERASNYHAKYGERKSAELSDDQKITSGQRYLAKRAVNSMKVNYIVITETATGPMVKLRPGVEIPSFPKLERGEEEPAGAESSEFVEKPLIATEAISEVSNGVQRGSDSDIPKGEDADLGDDPEWIDGGNSVGTAAEPVSELPAGLPQCDLCGMYVSNAEQHEAFHRKYPGYEREVQRSKGATPPACAFFSEDQVRAIVHAEVGRALDEFQQGMQRWLIHRFAALETLIDRPVRRQRW